MIAAYLIIGMAFISGFILGNWMADYQTHRIHIKESDLLDSMKDSELYKMRYGYSADTTVYSKQCSIELLQSWLDWFKCKNKN